MQRRLPDLPRPLLWISGLALLLALVLLADAIPFLRGGFGWQWPYRPAPLERGWPLLVGVAVYVAGAWALLRRRARIWPLLTWALLGALLIPLAIIALRGDVGYELFVRTISGGVTGPHLAGAEINWQDTGWRDWTAVMEGYNGRSAHLALSPPGLPLFYGALNGLLDSVPGLAGPLQRALLYYQCDNYQLLAYTPGQVASAAFGMLIPLWAALGVFPLYGVARRIHPARAHLAALWWPLVPALVMFAGSWNTFYPLASLLAFWLLLAGLERGALWLLLSGLLAGLLTFANFSVVPLIGLCGAYTLLHYVYNERGAHPWTRPVLAGIGFGAGLLIPWLFFWLAAGQTPFDLLHVALGTHLDLDRPYLPWLWLHFWDWAIFSGLPLILIWLWLAVRRLRAGLRPGAVLNVALLLTMLILLLSDTARGETGRVWLFFAPFVLIAAADFPAGAGQTRQAWLAVTSGQAALLVALAFSWHVISADDIRPPHPAPPIVEASQPINADFGGLFRLVSWQAAQEGSALILHFNWQAEQQMTTPYWFAAFPVTPEGRPAAEALVWQPDETRYPTTCWRPGQIIGETVRLPLPEDAAPGDWWVSVVAFPDVNDYSAALPVTLPGGPPDVQLGLGPVRVHTP